MHLRRFLALTCLLLSLATCRTARPTQADGRPEPPVRRVILLSLDGAPAETLQRIWSQGALTEGGFAQFFEKGQVADRLVPVNPTLTAVNHISLATGYAPEATGIVSNRFHPAGADFLDAVSGFEAPIGTETLWEAARRQGKKVGIVTWPGADGKGARRTADWGLIYVNTAEQEPALADLGRDAWSPVAAADPRLEGVRSFAPVLVARIAPRGFEIAAIDHTNDRKTAYDALVPLTEGERDALVPGDWASLPCAAASGQESRICQIKVLELAPDLSSTRVYLNGVYANAGYPEAFARQFADSGLQWPGPPDDSRLSATWQGKPGIDLATWVEQSERFTGFFGAALRFAAARDDWDLLMGYFPTIDEAGHQLLLEDPRQAGFTTQRRADFAQARLRVWQAVDRELAALLRVVDLRDTRIVIVSDHGMLPVHTVIDPNVLLREKGLLADTDGKIQEEGTTAWAVNAGAAHIYVRPDAPDRARLLADLRSFFADWTLEGARPIARAVLREDAGEIGLDHPNSGDLILFAAPGYSFQNGGLREGKAALPATTYGMHGNLNSDAGGDPALNSIYLALGAGLRKGNAGTVHNAEVAKRVAEWLGIEAPRREPPAP